MTKLKNLLIIKTLAVLIGVYTLTACGGNIGENQLTGTIRIDGSSTVYPITEAIAEEFRAAAPKVRVTIGFSGSGGGFKKLGRGEIDINNSSRPIKENEISELTGANIEYLQLTIAKDGVAVIIHPDNDWITSITTEELKKIWEPDAEDKITKWNHIRPEWPNERINLYGPDPASGTYDFFTEAIMGEKGKSRGDYTNSSDDNVLVQGVSTDKLAMGFLGLAYFEENADKLKKIGVDSGNGAVFPTFETVSNNTYFPLSRPVFLYVTREASKRPEVKKFVEFYLDNVAAIAKDVGYIALPAASYEAEKIKFAEFAK